MKIIDSIKLHGRMQALRNRYGLFFHVAMGFCMLSLVFWAGVAGYMLIEGWNFLDSLYMVVITLSTVGFQEVHPLSDNGRIGTIVLILSGVGSFAYLIGAFGTMLTEGRLQTYLGRRRVQKAIDKLENHVIICGHGRIGAIVASEIQFEGVPVVVIENQPEILAKLEEEGTLFIAGDATEDESLLAAGIARAKALVTALNLDSANVYVTLTARQLNPTLRIVSRVSAVTHIPKLERAGADHVLFPHLYGGLRMAQSVLRPTVVSFLELAMRGESMDLQMEEIMLKPGSQLAGKNLVESKIRQIYNLIVIAIKRSSGEMVFNPQSSVILENGDTLILVGRRDNLAKLSEIA